MASGPSGARPRLVCRTTPVALMTRRKRRPFEVRERPLDACRDVGLAGNARQNLRSCRIDGAADFGDHQRTRKSREACSKLFEHLMDSRKFAEFLRIAHEFDGTSLCARGATD